MLSWHAFAALHVLISFPGGAGGSAVAELEGPFGYQRSLLIGRAALCSVPEVGAY
jgi:hypothetical protein